MQVFVTPDNALVLAANQGTKDRPGTTVSFIDVKTFAVVGSVKTGKGAHGIVIEPAGRFAYVTNIYDNTVSVVDIAARKVVATIPTGAAPNGISFSSFADAPFRSAPVPLKLEGMAH